MTTAPRACPKCGLVFSPNVIGIGHECAVADQAPSAEAVEAALKWIGKLRASYHPASENGRLVTSIIEQVCDPLAAEVRRLRAQLDAANEGVLHAEMDKKRLAIEFDAARLRAKVQHGNMDTPLGVLPIDGVTVNRLSELAERLQADNKRLAEEVKEAHELIAGLTNLDARAKLIVKAQEEIARLTKELAEAQEESDTATRALGMAMKELAEARERAEANAKDAERLDRFERHDLSLVYLDEDRVWSCAVGKSDTVRWGKTAREALDDAVAALARSPAEMKT